MKLLNARAPGFAEDFARLVADRRESGGDVAQAVADIIAEVRTRGDGALADFTDDETQALAALLTRLAAAWPQAPR